VKRTQGTETSHYLEEKKTTVTPSVAASERGLAQTEEACLFGVVGPVFRMRVPKRNCLESQTIAGDSPVRERGKRTIRLLSRTRHVKASLNPRGPSRKAKYSLATDSEPSSASERWEEPLQGEDTEPETTCLQAVRAL
jgi:hypothetical protein